MPITGLIGRTPLVPLARFCAHYGLSATLLAKLEGMNPGGSAKDRAALFMVDDAVRRGLLPPGGTLIEATSGNTGTALAMIAAVRGYRCLIVMPESASIERRRLMAAYGAEVVLSPAAEGMRGAVTQAAALRDAIPGSLILEQFSNPANPRAHYRTTGPEIWAGCLGQVDALVAGVGTGGTISGTGRFLREMNGKIRIVGVEPAASPLLSCGFSAPHGLQGIGANFVPGVLDRAMLDEVIPVSQEDATDAMRTLARTEGILAGISSGAALAAAIALARRDDGRNWRIAVILPDRGDRYLILSSNENT